MRLGDLDDLKVHISELMLVYSGNELDNAILNAIDNAPTMPLPDFKEGYKQAIKDGKTNFSRPKGEWKIKGYKLECSNCENRVFIGTDDIGILNEEMLLFKFCPNCGADMKGGNEE